MADAGSIAGIGGSAGEMIIASASPSARRTRVGRAALLNGGAAASSVRTRAKGKTKAAIQALSSADVKLIMARLADDLRNALEQATDVVDHHLQHPRASQD